MLAETRKISRERASLAEVMASEMVARLDVMVKDVHVLTKRVSRCRRLASSLSFYDKYITVLFALLCLFSSDRFNIVLIWLCLQSKDLCIEIQDQFSKELRDLSEVSTK